MLMTKVWVSTSTMYKYIHVCQEVECDMHTNASMYMYQRNHLLVHVLDQVTSIHVVLYTCTEKYTY